MLKNFLHLFKVVYKHTNYFIHQRYRYQGITVEVISIYYHINLPIITGFDILKITLPKIKNQFSEFFIN